MLKVLVCGEGKHDIGMSSYGGSGARENGWLQILLNRFIKIEIKIFTISRNSLVLQRKEKKKYQPLPSGHGAKALALKLRAKSEKYDLVVFMADADTKRLNEWRKKREQILDGLCRVDGVDHVPCVPMSASESWLLADAQAWEKTGLKNQTGLPKQPEKIWGQRRDPKSNHPHQYFSRICVEAGVSDSLETRVQLANLLNCKTVQKTCPNSFVAFINDIRAVC